MFNAGYSAVISEIIALKFFACPTLKAYCFQSENNGSIKMRKFPESICDKYYESDGKLWSITSFLSRKINDFHWGKAFPNSNVKIVTVIFSSN